MLLGVRPSTSKFYGDTVQPIASCPIDWFTLPLRNWSFDSILQWERLRLKRQEAVS